MSVPLGPPPPTGDQPRKQPQGQWLTAHTSSLIYDSPACQLGIVTLNGSKTHQQQQPVQPLREADQWYPYSDGFMGIGKPVPAIGEDREWLGDAGQLLLPSSNLQHGAEVQGQQLQCSLGIVAQEIATYCFMQLLPDVSLFGAAAAADGIPGEQLQAATAAAERYGRLVFSSDALPQRLQQLTPVELLRDLQGCQLGSVADRVKELLYVYDANNEACGINPVCERWLAARFSKPQEIIGYMEDVVNIQPLQLAIQWWLTAMVWNELNAVADDGAGGADESAWGGACGKFSNSSGHGMPGISSNSSCSRDGKGGSGCDMQDSWGSGGSKSRCAEDGNACSSNSSSTVFIHYKQWHLWLRRMKEVLQQKLEIQQRKFRTFVNHAEGKVPHSICHVT